jgi:hypothetical protein
MEAKVNGLTDTMPFRDAVISTTTPEMSWLLRKDTDVVEVVPGNIDAESSGTDHVILGWLEGEFCGAGLGEGDARAKSVGSADATAGFLGEVWGDGDGAGLAARWKDKVTTRVATRIVTPTHFVLRFMS